jgi:hypothetical protein
LKPEKEKIIQPRLLNIRQAAAYLNCSVKTLRRLVMEKGVAYCQRVYKAPLFFDINDLDAYIQSIRIAAR